MMLLRGPGTPWWRLQAHRRALDELLYAEIGRRRESDVAGEDVLSMLMEARDEDGEGFTEVELRDQIMHLLFGGHDTTSSTLSFLFYELARNPLVMNRVVAELAGELGGRPPRIEDLLEGLPYLGMAVDETLRLYPPVWFGPRMSIREFEFGGFRIPAGVHVIHSSWVSHRLPSVFPSPDEFVPERFTPAARRELPPGAYIPFGGGQRICIGKRFGALMVKAVAATVLQHWQCSIAAGYRLKVSKLPTLSPEGGLQMVLERR